MKVATAVLFFCFVYFSVEAKELQDDKGLLKRFFLIEFKQHLFFFIKASSQKCSQIKTIDSFSRQSLKFTI